MIRAYLDGDAAAVETLLGTAWPHDSTLREISAIHGPDLESEDRWRRTLVYVRDGEVIGAGTLVATARHSSRYFVVVLVAPEARRSGVGSALLAELREVGVGRPLLARVRETDTAGLAFLDARGFHVVSEAVSASSIRRTPVSRHG